MMKRRRTLLTISMALALGLGVWTMAFTFQSASFVDGHVLEAADLNDLLNNNFSNVADALDDVADALEGKLDTSGGEITGRTDVSGAAFGEGGVSDPPTLFRVDNSSDTGSAAIFRNSSSSNESDNGVVSIKQTGTGPALSLKAAGGGPLISGAGPGQLTFVVEADGSIKIGEGAASDKPKLHLDAQAGTVTNSVGSGLPVAFGSVGGADGTKRGGTSNWSVERVGEGAALQYVISIDDVSYSTADYVTVVTPNAAGRFAISSYSGSDLAVRLTDDQGAPTSGSFHFVTYRAGN